MTKREEIERAEWIQLVLAVADNPVQLAQNLEHFHDIAFFRGRASMASGPVGGVPDVSPEYLADHAEVGT